MVNGLLKRWPKINFFIEILCSAILLIFGLNRYVNKHNCRLWSADQPEALQKIPAFFLLSSRLIQLSPNGFCNSCLLLSLEISTKERKFPVDTDFPELLTILLPMSDTIRERASKNAIVKLQGYSISILEP